jgi:hypothetical protein
MSEARESRLDYESALRVIGRHLDTEPTYHLSLLEVRDGFTVRSHPSRFRSDARTSQFTWDRLNDLVIFHMAGRGCLRRRPRHSGIWANFPNGHEDFFRALGHQLDDEQGNSLSVEELPDGVGVSYMRPARGDGLGNEKAHTVLAYADIEQMLEVARRRRQSPETESNSLQEAE